MAAESKTTSIRFTEEDVSILEWLSGRLGLAASQVVKLAIRRLYDAEGGKKKSK